MELLHRRCCGLDVHKETVVACLRLVADGKVTTEVRTFQTITSHLLRLSEWLAANECTHVAVEATGVYCEPVWHILDDGEFALLLANAEHARHTARLPPPGVTNRKSLASLIPVVVCTLFRARRHPGVTIFLLRSKFFALILRRKRLTGGVDCFVPYNSGWERRKSSFMASIEGRGSVSGTLRALFGNFSLMAAPIAELSVSSSTVSIGCWSAS